MNTIVVVDYGMGNLRSVAQALRHVAPDANVQISGDARVVASADRLVLPGQGGMPDCMRCLRESGLQQVVIDAARNKPLLGICVGEQMLFDRSEEGDTPCLGLLPGTVVRFQLDGQVQADGSRFKTPQMGWNRVRQSLSHPLWHKIADDSYFYFVHSYYVQPQHDNLVQATSCYPQPFVCAIARDNLFAVQFHPEKSQQAGLTLLRNFVNWNPV